MYAKTVWIAINNTVSNEGQVQGQWKMEKLT